MHTAPSGTSRAARPLANRKYRAPGHRPQTADHGPRRVRHAFLTQRLRPIAPVEVVRNGYLPGCNYISRENYEYLRACVQRYAELSGRPFAHDPVLTPGEGIGNLYRELRAMIGPDTCLNIETKQDRLVFVLWRPYRWGEYYYYWIPVKFVEKLNPALRRIAISFLHQFMRSTAMSPIGV